MDEGACPQLPDWNVCTRNAGARWSCRGCCLPLNVGDSEGKPMTGGNKYLMHFDKAQLPPVDAFWSITMYDAEGFQAANPIDRYAIGDRDPLKYNADGSLDIYLQHDRPDAAKEANWLPAATGPLGITMRLYAPKVEVLVPPAVERVG